jgi:hypothetical protein
MPPLSECSGENLVYRNGYGTLLFFLSSVAWDYTIGLLTELCQECLRRHTLLTTGCQALVIFRFSGFSYGLEGKEGPRGL